MKGSGQVITTTIRATARQIGAAAAEAWTIPTGIKVEASPTDEINILKYLRVMPEQPQELVWLVPQVGIDYTIESNTNWNIK